MAQSPESGLQPVVPHNIEGVIIRRTALDEETKRLVGLSQRLGRRLSYFLRCTPVHELPGEHWTKNYTAYAQTVLKILGEQRERAKLSSKRGADPLSVEDYARAVQKLAEEIVLGLTDAEFDRLSRMRLADRATAASRKAIEARSTP